ncbi:MAG TPA: hypothetical protein VFM79_02980 [Pelobium sp.]|nr:hypothetical protein [Pelobium sp.]
MITAIKTPIKAFTLLLLTTLSSLYTFAQEAPTKVDVDINADGGGSVWYGQPWVWAVGVAIFILVLVIVTRGNKSTDA